MLLARGCSRGLRRLGLCRKLVRQRRLNKTERDRARLSTRKRKSEAAKKSHLAEFGVHAADGVEHCDEARAVASLLTYQATLQMAQMMLKRKVDSCTHPRPRGT